MEASVSRRPREWFPARAGCLRGRLGAAPTAPLWGSARAAARTCRTTVSTSRSWAALIWASPAPRLARNCRAADRMGEVFRADAGSRGRVSGFASCNVAHARRLGSRMRIAG